MAGGGVDIARSRSDTRVMSRRTFVVYLMLALGVLLATAGADEPAPPPPPGAKDRCAVCGMYVAKYPTWVATIVRSDGSLLYFDGPKDMFRLLLEPTKHGQDPADLESVWVTDYYRTVQIPAGEALFVVGSDVVGPMGSELVPVSSAEAAAEFSADHGSTAILRFDEVGREHLGH